MYIPERKSCIHLGRIVQGICFLIFCKLHIFLWFCDTWWRGSSDLAKYPGRKKVRISHILSSAFLRLCDTWWRGSDLAKYLGERRCLHLDQFGQGICFLKPAWRCKKGRIKDQFGRNVFSQQAAMPNVFTTLRSPVRTLPAISSSRSKNVASQF